MTAMAGIMDNLMAALGYSKYIAQVTDCSGKNVQCVIKVNLSVCNKTCVQG